MDKFTVIDIGFVKGPPKRKILVVDDETSMHSLIFDILSSDYELSSAFDGQAGYEKAIAFQPALILMDLMMPGTSGYDAVRLLGHNSETSHIPVIVVTARNFDSTTIQMFQAERNVAAFISKPFHPHELREIIKTKLKPI